MKHTTHTIKIDAAKSLVLQPNKTGAGVRFSLVMFGADMASVVLTDEQCAVLITRIQIAQGQARGVTCQGDACAACQLPCLSPDLCGCRAP